MLLSYAKGPREKHQGSAEDLELGLLLAGTEGGGRDPCAAVLWESVLAPCEQ